MDGDTVRPDRGAGRIDIGRYSLLRLSRPTSQDQCPKIVWMHTDALPDGITKEDVVSHLMKQLPKFKHPDTFLLWPTDLSPKKPNRANAKKYLSQGIPLK